MSYSNSSISEVMNSSLFHIGELYDIGLGMFWGEGGRPHGTMGAFD